METRLTQNGASTEPVVYSARRHWAIVLPPFILLIFGGLSVQRKGIQAWIIMLISLAWMYFSATSLQKAEFLLTEGNLIVRSGLPWLKPFTVSLAAVGKIDVYQPVLGKFLDFGRIRITYADGTSKHLKMVRSPFVLMNRINECKAVLEEKK
jgi:uncharacterized membrane protein YdbT with pleckstrin-like domain